MIGKLLTIIEFILFISVGNYKTIERISKNDIIGMYALCRMHKILYEAGHIGYCNAAETLSTPNLVPSPLTPLPYNYDSGIEFPFWNFPSNKCLYFCKQTWNCSLFDLTINNFNKDLKKCFIESFLMQTLHMYFIWGIKLPLLIPHQRQ